MGKYSASDAVWIAAAIMAYEKYYGDQEHVSGLDMYFKQSEIVKRAQNFTDNNVDNAIVSWWVNADNEKHTQNYLRADLKNSPSLRRLSMMDEFADNSYPEALDQNEEFSVNGKTYRIGDLLQFVRKVYPSVIQRITSEYVLGVEKIEYWPSLEQYNPGITKEKWSEMLVDKDMTTMDDLRFFKCWLLEGGESTCANAAEKFGGKPAMYNVRGRNYADKVKMALDIESCDDDGKARTFPIVFRGRYIMEHGKKRYSWKLRNELKAALEDIDLSDVDVHTNEADTVEFDKNIILYGPPGTGKTYNTAIYAVAICDNLSIEEVRTKPYSEVMERYQQLKDVEKRVVFTTFHQSYGYEEFIEGIKPKIDNESRDVEYIIKDGVFKAFCDRAGQIRAKTNKAAVRDDARIWNVILGGNSAPELKSICFKEGTIRIGWSRQPEIITEETEGLNDKERRILLNFQDEMAEGDIIVSRYNYTSIDGIGIVKGECEFDDSVEEYPRKRDVDWIYTGDPIEILSLNGGTRLDRKSVYALDRVNLTDLLGLIQESKDSGLDIRDQTRPYVFIIDEINRGNISKIFGELITLIDPTKRKGEEEAMEAILPYSNKPFGVPGNVYLIGTMNTADRSIALMDTALRRRFRFEEMMPDPQVIRNIHADKVEEGGITLDVAEMLETINRRIEYLYDREHTIGHAFFTGLKDEPTVEKLASIFMRSVIPLLQEYFYEDYSKIMLVLGDDGKKNNKEKFILAKETKANTIFRGDISDVDLPDYSYEIQKDAFYNIKSYAEIKG